MQLLRRPQSHPLGSSRCWSGLSSILCSASELADAGRQASQCVLSQVYVPSHPLVKHWLAVARNRLSPPPVFRSALAELGRLLIYEAIEQEGWLPTVEGQAETPCGTADVTFIDPSRPVMVHFAPIFSLQDAAACKGKTAMGPGG